MRIDHEIETNQRNEIGVGLVSESSYKKAKWVHRMRKDGLGAMNQRKHGRSLRVCCRTRQYLRV